MRHQSPKAEVITRAVIHTDGGIKESFYWKNIGCWDNLLSSKMNPGLVVKWLKGLTANKWQSQGGTPGPISLAYYLFFCITFLPAKWDSDYLTTITKPWKIPNLVVRENSGHMNLSPDSSIIDLTTTKKSISPSSIVTFLLPREVHFDSSKPYAKDQRIGGQTASFSQFGLI